MIIYHSAPLACKCNLRNDMRESFKDYCFNLGGLRLTLAQNDILDTLANSLKFSRSVSMNPRVNLDYGYSDLDL